MTKILISLALALGMLITARPAQAQDAKPLTVAVGTTSLREQPPGDFEATEYDRGWAVLASYTFFWDRIGVAVDFGANKHTNIVGEPQELKYRLVGARYDIARTRWLVPYAQVLFGREEFSEPGFVETGFATQIGGGVDAFVWKGIGGRAQVDYRITDYDGAKFKDWRVFLGGVVAIGW